MSEPIRAKERMRVSPPPAPVTETVPAKPTTFIEGGKVLGYCVTHRPKWCDLDCPQRVWYVD
jgi:hypothetical protein